MKETILIIEDEPDIRALLASVLDQEGYTALTAANGLDGLERFRADKPDLVLTDVKMPRKDGLDVLKEIRAAGTDVDVIILTGHSDESTAIDCLRLGAYDYLLKPLEELDVLLVSIERALHKRMLEINNRQLSWQIEEMATKDPLTGLLNLRQLDASLDEEIARSKRYGRVFCNFMLAIDQFQAVNATHGPPFGDYVLQRLTELMRLHLRAVDHCFRYNGAIFFVILPETNQAEAEVAANRLITAVREYPFRCAEQQTHITLSIGSVLYPEQVQEKAALLRHAEKALDRAQKMGGDRMISRT